MKLVAGVTFLVSVLMGCGGGAPAAPSTSADQNANAALRYLRAYAALRQIRPMPLDPATLGDTYLTVPLESPVEDLVAAAEPAMKELRNGAALPRCDWEVSYNDGPFADTSHRGAARELIAVAGLRARLRFRGGQPMQAADDLLVAITMARHLSLDGSLASPLIAQRLELGLATLLARFLPQVPVADLDQIAARLEALPVGMRFAAALLSHEEMSRGILLGEARAARNGRDLIMRLNALPMMAGRAQEVLDGCGGTTDGVKRCVEDIQSQYRDWAQRSASLSPDDFQKQYDTEAASLASSNSVFRLLHPSLTRFRWAYAYDETRRALLRAALGVQAEGIAALNRHRDPYDRNPFSHVAAAGGFTLHSRLRQDNRPLSISVGSASN